MIRPRLAPTEVPSGIGQAEWIVQYIAVECFDLMTALDADAESPIEVT